jgi:hypothetical protein
LEKASRLVTAVWRVLGKEMGLVEEHGTDLDVAALWRAVESLASREEVNAAAATVEELVPPGDDATEAVVRALLASRYNTVRPFLTLLGESTALGAASDGRRVLAAVQNARTVEAPGEGQAAAAQGDRQQAGAAGLAAGGVQHRGPPGRGGGPRRICGVRTGTALSRTSAPGRVRVTVEPVVRPAGVTAGWQGVGGGA